MLARVEQRPGRQGQEKVSRSRSIRNKALTSRQLAKRIVKFADDKKAQDIVILDMRRVVNFCDYFVIATGTSDRQVKAIAEGINEGLSGLDLHVNLARSVKGFSALPSLEASQGAWVLLDMGDVVAHVFEPNAREFYSLEHLWQDAPRVEYKPRSRKKARPSHVRPSSTTIK